ncbi:hypothetical protein [Lachnoanaerobaculum umeaense]|jgi:hypothetical protein|uniref:Uncharacterized protein n=1 Tax=Lachnoanaerobaculum umeaense TaxID=617123 RepID=A0A385Q2N4_9FIRM|nr:hypothetical protein [Lachnoanaerobaculum umeaense]AYA98813.1 hypothetical protein D4A81_02025 [Lachnoanaerobaculum umeaense]PZW91585.1 hypothetical protein C7439_14111 [Lachnoanaerobaculum umeaense]
MGIENWFNFETAKQKKKKMDRYYKKLYPFGEEQKNWEQERLDKAFVNNKRTKSYHFELLILRESIANLSDPDIYDEDEERPSVEDVIQNWIKKETVYKLKPEEKQMLADIALEEMKKFK